MDQEEYSIKPEDYGKLPLFVEGANSNTLLNELFCYACSKIHKMQGMKKLSISSIEEAPECFAATYPGNGPALEPSLCYSKEFVAYFESFLGVAPWPAGRQFKGCNIEARIEDLYANAMRRLSSTQEDAYVKYIGRKMHGWYKRFPPSGDPAAEDSGDDEAHGGRAEGDGQVGEGPTLEASGSDSD